MTDSQNNRFIIVAVPLIILAYLIPWVINTSTGLTPGAYDLAEWLNLHPATHPTRLPGLLIRGQLCLLTLFVALSVNKPRFTIGWWLRLVSVLLLVIAQLPPPEFLAWTGDQNQRQQALLAITSLIGGGVIFTGFLHRYRNYLQMIVALVAIVSTIFALAQIIPRMRDFDLSPRPGLGVFLLIGVYVSWVLLSGLAMRNENRVTKL